MSLGLPEFGSRGNAPRSHGVWRMVQVTGLVALTYTALLAGKDWGAAYSADLSNEKARVEVSQAAKSAEETKRGLQKSPDLLTATASVESSPERVLTDLNEVLPEGVSLTGLRIEYTSDATARLDFSVLARTPGAYDRFLGALSKSPLFTDIKPGSESRPGFVRASVTVIHRARGKRR